MPYLICVCRLDLSNDCDEEGEEWKRERDRNGEERRREGEERGREREKLLNARLLCEQLYLVHRKSEHWYIVLYLKR